MYVPGVQERRFIAGNLVLNYAEGPRIGRPFVILHGGAARWQHGQEFVETMARTWHVYAPDLRGHGQSGHVAGQYLLRDYVADVARFLAQVVSERAVLFGHSLGGEVGVMLAAYYPDALRGLIVADAPLAISVQGAATPAQRAQNELWHRLAGRPEREIVLALRESPVHVPGEAAMRTAADVFGAESPWFVHQATSLHQLDPDVLAHVLAGPEHMLAGYDAATLLPRITCPVLLLQADPTIDNILPDDHIALAMRLLPKPTHVQLKGVGHPLHSAPGGTEIVIRAIGPFLGHLERMDGAPDVSAPLGADTGGERI